MIADKGPEQAMLENEALMKGLNTYDGKITCSGVAKSLGKTFVDPYTLIK
jgi:alanine dehydrogenase